MILNSIDLTKTIEVKLRPTNGVAYTIMVNNVVMYDNQSKSECRIKYDSFSKRDEKMVFGKFKNGRFERINKMENLIKRKLERDSFYGLDLSNTDSSKNPKYTVRFNDELKIISIYTSCYIQAISLLNSSNMSFRDIEGEIVTLTGIYRENFVQNFTRELTMSYIDLSIKYLIPKVKRNKRLSFYHFDGLFLPVYFVGNWFKNPFIEIDSFSKIFKQTHFFDKLNEISFVEDRGIQIYYMTNLEISQSLDLEETLIFNFRLLNYLMAETVQNGFLGKDDIVREITLEDGIKDLTDDEYYALSEADKLEVRTSTQFRRIINGFDFIKRNLKEYYHDMLVNAELKGR